MIKIYDLEERTAKFGEEVVRFTQKISKNEITRPLITQLVKAGTSIGANYCEADDAESSKDFKHKIAIAKKRGQRNKTLVKTSCCSLPRIRRRNEKTLARGKGAKSYF